MPDEAWRSSRDFCRRERDPPLPGRVRRAQPRLACAARCRRAQASFERHAQRLADRGGRGRSDRAGGALDRRAATRPRSGGGGRRPGERTWSSCTASRDIRRAMRGQQIDRVRWLRETFPAHQVGFADHVALRRPAGEPGWPPWPSGCGATRNREASDDGAGIARDRLPGRPGPGRLRAVRRRTCERLRRVRAADASRARRLRDVGKRARVSNRASKAGRSPSRDLAGGTETIRAERHRHEADADTDDVLYDTRLVVGRQLGTATSAQTSRSRSTALA